MPRAKRVIEEEDDAIVEVLPASTEDETEGALLLTKDDTRLLSSYLGRNIQSRSDLLQAAQKVSTINVNGREITLEPALLQRIKSRCIRADFPLFLEATIKGLLHSFVGW